MDATILKKTDYIEKNQNILQVSGKAVKHLQVCTVECAGINQWTHEFYSDCASYAVLLEKYLLDLPSPLFIVYQINEHSRGGFYEYETQIINMKGEVLNQFASKYDSEFILSGEYIWFLTSGKEKRNLTQGCDLELVILNSNTAKVKQRFNLNYPQLLNYPYSTILWVRLKVKHKQGLLEIEYTDTLKKNNVKYVPISLFLE